MPEPELPLSLPQIAASMLLLLAVIVVVVSPAAALLWIYLERKRDYDRDAVSQQEFNEAISSQQSSTKQTGSPPAGTASNSRYIPEAARELPLLEQAADEASCKEAVRDGTREAYTSYLQESPEGLNATEARDPHDHPPPPRYGDRTFRIVASIVLLITLAGGGLL